MKRSEDRQRGRQKDLSSFRVLDPLISNLSHSKSSVPSPDLNAVNKMQLEALVSINSAAKNLSILGENYLERAEGRIEETDRTKFYTLAANLFAKSGRLKKIESLLLAYSDNYSRSCAVFNDSNMLFSRAIFLFDKIARKDAIEKITRELDEVRELSIPIFASCCKTTLTSAPAFAKLKKDTIFYCSHAVSLLTICGSIYTGGYEYSSIFPYDQLAAGKMFMLAAPLVRIEAELLANLGKYDESAAAFARCSALYEILIQLFPKGDFCYQKANYESDAYIRHDVFVKSATDHLKKSSSSATELTLAMAYFNEAGDAITDLLKLDSFENSDGNIVIVHPAVLVQSGISAYRSAVDLLYIMNASEDLRQSTIEKMVNLASAI